MLTVAEGSVLLWTSGGVATRYVLPVSLITSCFHLARSACLPTSLCSVCVNCFLVTFRPIISGSTWPIFIIFSPNGRYLIVDYRSVPLFPITQGILPWQPILMAKFAYDLHSSNWHTETDRDIAMPMGALTAAVIWLHRVKIWWTSVQ